MSMKSNSKTETKKFLEEQGLMPTFKWQVQSKSNPSEYHIVEWYEDDHWECDCMGYMTHKVCRHIRIKQNELKGRTYRKNYKRS